MKSLVSIFVFLSGVLADARICPPPTTRVQGGPLVQTSCSATSAEDDWKNRSTASGVIAAYDFSNLPSNGGDWTWGSLKPGITVMSYKQSEYPTARLVDRAVVPPGSSASLRWDLPQGTSERSDNWFISIDKYSEQIGENDEVWIQWKQRVNSPMATLAFAQLGGRTTTWKSLMVSEGMQSPMPYSPKRAYYGFQGTNTKENNTLNDVRFCSENEIVMIARHGGQSEYKWPRMYHGCSFYQPFTTYTGNAYTDMNKGLSNPTSCLYSGSTGNAADPQSCFLYKPDTWLTLMVHIKTGPQGTGNSSLGGGAQSGFTNSTVEYYGGLPGQPVQLLHRASGIVIRRGNSPGEAGWSPTQKLGVFSWALFMTLKDPAQTHAIAQTWISQIIISRNRIADPLY